MKNELEFTKNLPDKEGYYWWTNFGEHTPTVLKVSIYGKGFYASNGEYEFEVCKPKIDKDPEMKVDGHYFGEEMWCYIEVPTMDGKTIEFDCY